jgi:hypothetical protein
MSQRTLLSLPVAIVAAGALIAVAVYFGLRDQSTPAARPPPAATPTAPSPSAPPPPPPPPPDPGAREKVAEQLAASFAELRPKLLASCWTPIADTLEEPRMWKATYVFSFDHNGNQVSRGVMIDRGSARADIGSCVQQHLPHFALGAAAAQVSDIPVEVVFP